MSGEIRYWGGCDSCDATWDVRAWDSHRALNIDLDRHSEQNAGHHVFIEKQSERVARMERYAFANYVRLRVLQTPVYKYELPAFLWIRKHWSTR